MSTHRNPRDRLGIHPYKGVRSCKGCRRIASKSPPKVSPWPRLQWKPYRLIPVQSLRLACVMRGSKCWCWLTRPFEHICALAKRPS
jgi:hypothetical protein